jgi:hypothetical protein
MLISNCTFSQNIELGWLNPGGSSGTSIIEFSDNSKYFLSVDDIVSKIFLPNGTVALLSKYYSANYTAQVLESVLFLETQNSSTTFMQFISYDPPSMYIGHYSVEEKWDYSKLEWDILGIIK